MFQLTIHRSIFFRDIKWILLSVLCMFFHQGFSQIPPEGFNYNAIARNASGQPVIAAPIGLQISVLKGSATGVAVLVENHTVNTDSLGLFSIIIGQGSAQIGSMSTIAWNNDNYFIKVGLDISGGTNFVNMGTTQLLSVPYAMHSKTADSLIGGGNGAASSNGFSHFIGEYFGGGIIYYLWKDTIGNEHGLILGLYNISNNADWSNVVSLIGPNAQSPIDGLANCNAIINQAGHTSSAASLCLNTNMSSSQTDWYLPSIIELSLVATNYFDVTKALEQTPNATTLSPLNYQSSSEFSSTDNLCYHFGLFRAGNSNKGSSNIVRPIRSF